MSDSEDELGEGPDRMMVNGGSMDAVDEDGFRTDTAVEDRVKDDAEDLSIDELEELEALEQGEVLFRTGPDDLERDRRKELRERFSRAWENETPQNKMFRYVFENGQIFRDFQELSETAIMESAKYLRDQCELMAQAHEKSSIMLTQAIEQSEEVEDDVRKTRNREESIAEALKYVEKSYESIVHGIARQQMDERKSGYSRDTDGLTGEEMMTGAVAADAVFSDLRKKQEMNSHLNQLSRISGAMMSYISGQYDVEVEDLKERTGLQKVPVVTDGEESEYRMLQDVLRNYAAS
ncbi:MAG: hypothetical protein ABEK01_04360 [Candidatus Nanohaloarchaea archaeon]